MAKGKTQEDALASLKQASVVDLTEVSLEPLQETDSPSDPLRAEISFGSEDREKISDTRKAPYRFICRIDGSKRVGNRVRRKVGTAFVIGRRTLVTAAHNLWLDENGRPNTLPRNRIQRFKVYPGLSSAGAPFGSFEAAGTAFPAYGRQLAIHNDAAVLRLTQPLPASFSKLHWVPVDPDELDRKIGYVSGYPACRPGLNRCPSPQPDQYYHNGTMIARNGLLHYLTDTSAGQSGSPVIVMTPTSNNKVRSTAVGIHVKGGTRDQRHVNRAVALRRDIAIFIQQKLVEFESNS